MRVCGHVNIWNGTDRPFVSSFPFLYLRRSTAQSSSRTAVLEWASILVKASEASSPYSQACEPLFLFSWHFPGGTSETCLCHRAPQFCAWLWISPRCAVILSCSIWKAHNCSLWLRPLRPKLDIRSLVWKQLVPHHLTTLRRPEISIAAAPVSHAVMHSFNNSREHHQAQSSYKMSLCWTK